MSSINPVASSGIEQTRPQPRTNDVREQREAKETRVTERTEENQEVKESRKESIRESDVKRDELRADIAAKEQSNKRGQYLDVNA